MQVVGSPAVVWTREDLRLDDNPAFAAAVAAAGPVVPVFVWSPEEEGNWPPGAASRWWLHHSLAAFASRLKGVESRLILRSGDSIRELEAIVRATRAGSVHWNRRMEPAARAREARVASALRDLGVEVRPHAENLLFHPEDIRTGSGGPYKVFTPFWRSCMSGPGPRPPAPPPVRILSPQSWPVSLPLNGLALKPEIDWAAGLRAAWKPGEQGAAAQLREFLDGPMAVYPEERNRPDRRGSSRLSPHLHFGEISVRRIWHEISEALRGDPGKVLKQAARVYLRELGWREFAHHLLYHFPDMAERPLRPEFDDFPWARNPRGLRAWQRGLTGYPIVDAGMRELWGCGWMHNRVRMIAASFLVKDLLLPWREGARWFWDTLVDADLAGNTLGWQWTAGCGADAAPFFRIFNPVLQGEKFDPLGDYVRAWVPELSGLPARWIHRPWEAPQQVLAEAGIKFGRDYPLPVVDHSEARARALAALGELKRRPP